MRLLVVLIALSAVAVAQHPASITFDELSRSNPGAAFDHGFVAAWDLVQVHSLTLYDTDGRRLFDLTSLTLPDGTKTNTPISVDIDSDGTSALAYWVNSSLRAGFALVDKTGNQIRIVETQPYRPSQVCFAPDHSIWMFGDQWNSKAQPDADFMTFRHYSRDGKLLGSFVPRSTLPAWEGAGLDGAVAPFIGHWRLRASKDRIGAALLLGNHKQVWIELDLQGQLIGQWTDTFSAPEWVMPVAFDSDSLLYGEHRMREKRVGISVFDRSTSTWKPAPSLPKGRLLGADGALLVYQNGDELRWVEGLNVQTESASIVCPKQAGSAPEAPGR